MNYHTATDDQLRQVLNTIREGDVFTTDRIALDPFFSSKLAGRRYALWMNDVLKDKHASMILISYKGVDIGFSVHVNKGNHYEMLLGGLFPEYLQSGLGLILSYGGLVAAYEEGARRVRSHVSSNNPSMFKQHLLCGMGIKSMTHNYIRHK